MSTIYYRCKNCGFERLLNLSNEKDIITISCPECGKEIIYSEQIEKEWINETDENGKRIRVDFKGIDEQQCVSEACAYFKCQKNELDHCIIKWKSFFSSFTIRAWKSVPNITSKDVKIILNSSNVNGWIAINPIDKIITKPFDVIASLSPVHIKYDKVSSIKYKESAGCINCELILDPYNVLDVGFYPNERNNVDTLIDTLYDDLPQSENEMYTTCFFKRSDIPSNSKICHIVIDNIDINFGDSCFVWKDADSLCICNTVLRNGMKIKVSDIKYYRIVGDKYITTEVTGGGGGGSSIKGAIIGGIIGGEAGAIIGSRKPVEAVKSSSIVHDKQSVLMYCRDSSIILKFNSKVFDILLDMLPEKEYEYTIHETKETDQNIKSDTTDFKSRLKELKSMYEEDLITEEEYNNKKQELLSKM
ncbi:MAG: hypothetical protein HDR21_15105 [Lachnospiraceae bacterium]|nr:hypothetical protein [Lachnospiraceae bacterium]MBD5482220.1 hypothetical protein [Lachnospiraceae bacterium]